MSVDRWIARLAAAGALPTDTDEERLRKALLTFTASSIAPLAVLWGALYLVLDLPLSGAIPLTYAVVSLLSLAYFFRTKRYGLFRFSQLWLILLLPFLLRWSLGGFVAGSAVIALLKISSARSTGWRIAMASRSRTAFRPASR